MLPIKGLSKRVSVSGSLSAADFAVIKDLGFDKVINFRPDNEVPGQLSDAEPRSATQSLGFQYVHIPVTKRALFTDDVVSRATRELASEGRVFGYCTSGLRAAIVWAAATARTMPVDEVLSSLHNAGFDLPFIRDDLEAQADKVRWSKNGVAA
jgi:sulfide:quinone oxidoreductase